MGIERNLISYLLKHGKILIFGIITCLGVVIRLCLFKFRSGDYDIYLSTWYEQIRELGGIKALHFQVGDYGVPYQLIIDLFTYIPINNLYLYKALSSLFDFILAFYGALLCKQFNKKIDFNVIYGIILMIPTVILNSALWAQCDSIYCSFVCISLYYLMKNKPLPSFIFLGIAFSFKLQTIFIFPAYILFYLIKKNISCVHFLIILVSMYVMNIPGFIAGRDLLTPIKVYMNQTNEYKQYGLNFNYPNFASIFNSVGKHYFDSFSKFLVIFTILSLVVIYTIVLDKLEDTNFEAIHIIALSMITVFTMVVLLPSMHERYGYLLDLMLLFSAVIDKRYILSFFVMAMVSLIAYSKTNFGIQYPLVFTSVIVLATYVYSCYIAYDFFISREMPSLKKNR
ncbi:hypothetical protein [uncultured Limosilactobacillus sp.]|uniref:hypothetical protein n=2 Tax=Limosilactobacillus TaxID=2742598 RepID=UPI0025D80575|nr:hypothetical protein [uncultured Limosilactobacillus sp.]